MRMIAGYDRQQAIYKQLLRTCASVQFRKKESNLGMAYTGRAKLVRRAHASRHFSKRD